MSNPEAERLQRGIDYLERKLAFFREEWKLVLTAYRAVMEPDMPHGVLRHMAELTLSEAIMNWERENKGDT